MESLLISLAAVVIICLLIWYFTRLLPPPGPLVGKVIVILGSSIWLLTHLTAIVNLIAGR